jgi:hypothetical protein
MVCTYILDLHKVLTSGSAVARGSQNLMATSGHDERTYMCSKALVERVCPSLLPTVPSNHSNQGPAEQPPIAPTRTPHSCWINVGSSIPSHRILGESASVGGSLSALLASRIHICERRLGSSASGIGVLPTKINTLNMQHDEVVHNRKMSRLVYSKPLRVLMESSMDTHNAYKRHNHTCAMHMHAESCLHRNGRVHA